MNSYIILGAIVLGAIILLASLLAFVNKNYIRIPPNMAVTSASRLTWQRSFSVERK